MAVPRKFSTAETGGFETEMLRKTRMLSIGKSDIIVLYTVANVFVLIMSATVPRKAPHFLLPYPKFFE